LICNIVSELDAEMGRPSPTPKWAVADERRLRRQRPVRLATPTRSEAALQQSRETEGVELKLRISDFAVAAEIRCCRTRLIATGGAYIIIDWMALALIARE
jgi:hypothetical protein